MKTTLLFFCLLSFAWSYGQDLSYSKEEINFKLDSIMKEANLLYKYERASWVSTDLANEKADVKSNFGGYLTYVSNDTFKTIIFDKEQKNCIAEFIFIDDFKKAKTRIFAERPLTQTEGNLQNIKKKIVDQLSDTKYGVGVPDGFDLNLTLMPVGENYKLYIITGTAQSNVIPFGNDYLFYANKEGVIGDWKKFHSRLIEANTTMPGGGKIVEAIHSHLRTTPFISATDICTFKLYAALCGLEAFSVYSPALGKRFKYDLMKDKVEVVEK